MEKLYRLKKDAVKFFKEKHATAIHMLDTWQKMQVDVEALEEVKPAYITYGIKDRDSCSSLCGWNEEKGAHFHFTLIFPSQKIREYDQFSNGKVVRTLMEKIQSQLDWFYQDFINKEE